MAIASGHRRLRQQVAERQRVLDRERVVDGGLDGPHRLVGKSLEPEDARQRDARGHALVELKAHDVRPVRGADIALQHAFDVAARSRLLSEEVQRRADHPLADERIGRVARRGRHDAETARPAAAPGETLRC